MFSSCNREKLFLSILGHSIDGIKPFECIGTAEESITALELTLYQHLKFTEVENLSELLLRLCQQCDIFIEEIIQNKNNSEISTIDILTKWIKKKQQNKKLEC